MTRAARVSLAILVAAAAAMTAMTASVVAAGAPVGEGAKAVRGEAVALTLAPAQPVLTGPESSQQLLVLRTRDGEFHGEAAGTGFVSSDPAVAEVGGDGVVRARGNGTATITARSEEGAAATVVTVEAYDRPQAWSFRNHLLPVLTKSGCNQGACHGALAGKGGFRLSLLGYDPAGDYERITREAQGRRIELEAPARSLVLTKPTTAVRHKGGKRLDPDSREYRMFTEWIRGGAAPPRDGDARVARLEVTPVQSILKPGDAQRLVVRAHYTDGRAEDVTAWAKFTSVDETVARVDEKSGEVRVVGHGETAVSVWFSSRIVLARITSPYPNQVPDALYASEPRQNLIDRHVLDQLQRLRLKPSPRTGDAAFIRRASLDTVGLLPTPEEVRAFLESDARDKRERLIDRLLAREEFVDYWTYRWSDLFLMNGRLLRPAAVKAYYEWLRGNVERNTPWDDLVRQVVLAKGDSMDNGASNFYALHQDPESMAENVSQAFLSLSINCAKCHNHPLEKWTNDQYYSFANLFARVRAKGWGGDPRGGDGGRTVYVENHGELIQPRTGRAQPPAPLDGEPVAAGDGTDRREPLAAWLTSPENPYFTRSIVNRVWAALMGVGLVEPVDDLRASNPASNAPLLEALAGYLVDQHYDLKSLMRLILTSETYQRSSQPLPENETESRFFSRYYPRRLMAEVLQDAIVGITDLPEKFSLLELTDGSTEKTALYPAGTRALELYDSSVASYFLKTFGRNERAITCECERSNQPSMIQILHLANGEVLNGKLRDPNSRISRLLDSGLNDSDLVTSAYMWCLSRPPTPREASEFAGQLGAASAGERREVVEDMFWALMTSREFLFQH